MFKPRICNMLPLFPSDFVSEVKLIKNVEIKTLFLQLEQAVQRDPIFCGPERAQTTLGFSEKCPSEKSGNFWIHLKIELAMIKLDNPNLASSGFIAGSPLLMILYWCNTQIYYSNKASKNRSQGVPLMPELDNKIKFTHGSLEKALNSQKTVKNQRSSFLKIFGVDVAGSPRWEQPPPQPPRRVAV